MMLARFTPPPPPPAGALLPRFAGIIFFVIVARLIEL